MVSGMYDSSCAWKGYSQANRGGSVGSVRATPRAAEAGRLVEYEIAKDGRASDISVPKFGRDMAHRLTGGKAS